MRLFKLRAKFFTVIIFLYVLLVQFVIPVNKYIPKPSILIESFNDINIEYNLIPSLFLTTITVLSLLLFSYLTVFIFRAKIISVYINFPNITNILKTFKYFPLLAVTIISFLWFGTNFITEFIFLFMIAVFYWLSKIYDLHRNVGTAYIESAQSLGVSNIKIYKEIYWKNMEPNLMPSLKNINLFLWSSALLIEYVSGNFGTGSVYFQGFMYKDISLIFILTIIVAIVISLIDLIINWIIKYLIYWETD